MFESRSGKRFRAIAMALVLTFAANFAISYAAASGANNPVAKPPVSRSGANNPVAKPPVN